MLRSLVTAGRTLTIVPLPGKDTDRFERSLPWFPVVGVGLGAIAAIVLHAGAWLGHDLAAALSLGVLALATGALHLDGVADSADGLGCRGDRERRLRIMKEPGVGAFAVVALVVLLITKWAALSTLAVRGEPLAVISACSLGRAMIPVQCVLQPYARASGTGAAVVEGARPWHAVVAVALALVTAWPTQGWKALLTVFGALLLTSALGWVSRKRLGGITGDVLGATCELGETFGLIASCLISAAFL
jgi:adenosylcobinamide-GDP ribazoletransferase